MTSKEEARQRWFYEQLWPHAAALLQLARVLTHNHAEAEDLVQETMLKAFQANKTFQDGTGLKAWLTSILRNTWIDRLRAGKASAGTVSLDGFEEDELAGPASRAEAEGVWENPEQILNAFSDQQIIDALHQLPDAIRWTLLLTDVEGFDHQTAAGILEVPAGTVKSRVHRGHAMLREILLPLAQELRLVPRQTDVQVHCEEEAQ